MMAWLFGGQRGWPCPHHSSGLLGSGGYWLWGLGPRALEAATGGPPAAGGMHLGSDPTGLWTGFREYLSAFHFVFIVVGTPSMRSG